MENVIITIARQHGSGGRLIGECLAKKMGIAYYDKELISLTAKKTGFALDFVKEVEEKQTASFLYSIYAAATVPSVYEQARNAQFAVIRELAEQGPCVIVGRAADCILKNFPMSSSMHHWTNASAVPVTTTKSPWTIRSEPFKRRTNPAPPSTTPTLNTPGAISATMIWPSTAPSALKNPQTSSGTT